MSLLSKLFVILVFVIALVKLGIDVTLFAHKVDWKDKFVKEVNYHYQTQQIKNAEIAAREMEIENNKVFIGVLNERIGIQNGLMTTVHAYTNDQVLTDVYHEDLRRARSATMSMIPTKTGAAAALGLVLPELNGKLDGVSIRVPTPNVSVIDLKIVAKKQTTKEEINDAVKRAAEQQLKGILNYTNDPNVSIDFNHDPHSSTFHMDQTKVINGTLVRVMAWYDNEWGFSNRMADTAVAMGKLA